MIDSKKIIVSLDGIEILRAISIAEMLSGKVWGYKINDLLYADEGVVEQLRAHGNVFVDVKLHDIPSTVANTVRRLIEKGADIITVHAEGGVPMMRAAKEVSGDCKIIAVTVLTSEVHDDTTSEVLRRTEEALRGGVDGIVCSGHELASLTSLPGIESKLKIVPGIRPAWYAAKDDQVRTMTPEEALELGADYLVVGRPIVHTEDPLTALDRLCRE